MIMKLETSGCSSCRILVIWFVWLDCPLEDFDDFPIDNLSESCSEREVIMTPFGIGDQVILEHRYCHQNNQRRQYDEYIQS